MRDKARLIQVLWSVNRNAVGPAALALHAAAAHLELADASGLPSFVMLRLHDAMEHPSPHVQELASEAYDHLLAAGRL
jgi:hypothetical protein